MGRQTCCQSRPCPPPPNRTLSDVRHDGSSSGLRHRVQKGVNRCTSQSRSSSKGHTHTHTRSLRTCPEKVAAALINRIQCSSNFLINQAQCSAVGRSLRSFRRRESLFSPFTTSAEFALNMFSTVAKTFKPRETEDLSCRDVLKGS